ncbi:MAG: hypothetical protein IJL21_04205 [Alphaproteobacteria bacterium]|nr:hypothetical protein [Alphaproteobacteria bacterium]
MKKINIFNRNTNSPSYRRMPVSRGFNRGGGIPLFSGMTAVIFALFVATPSFAEPTELDKKTVASKAYVDTKQDIIETGSMTFNVPEAGSDYTVSNMLIFSGGNGITGTQIGLIDSSDILAIYEDLGVTDYDILDLRGSGVSDATLSRLVPTVKALSDALTPLSWDSTKDTKAINAYYTTFGTDTNNWAGNGADLINGRFLAKSLALKQNKIAKSGYYYNTSGTLTAYGNSSATNGWLHAGVKGTGLVTKTATEGVVGERKIFEATDVANYHATGLTRIQQDIQDISIPTVGAMMTAIANGANAALPTGTTGTVVTYNGVNAETGVQEFTETAISGTATYDDNDQLTNGNNIANVSLVETEIATRQKKRTCAGYEPGHENEADYCWLWNFPDD